MKICGSTSPDTSLMIQVYLVNYVNMFAIGNYTRFITLPHDVTDSDLNDGILAGGIASRCQNLGKVETNIIK